MKKLPTKLANGRVTPPTWRRNLNDGFLNPDGSFSWAKFFTTCTQTSLLYHLNAHFEALMKSWDSLAVVLVVLIAPEMFKKLVSMKYGGGSPAAPR